MRCGAGFIAGLFGIFCDQSERVDEQRPVFHGRELFYQTVEMGARLAVIALVLQNGRLAEIKREALHAADPL